MTYNAYFVVFLDSSDNHKGKAFGIYSEPCPTTIGSIVPKVLHTTGGRTYQEAYDNMIHVLITSGVQSDRIPGFSSDWKHKLKS